MRNIVCISGKGGVGKTTVSLALARTLARDGRRVLWAEFENPMKKPGEVTPLEPGLTAVNCDGPLAFDEFIALKLKIPGLAKILTGNKVIRYLAKAAPGIHEMVLLGKVWYERLQYDHVILDMPSTGYSLAMFQSTKNFSRLFSGGPLQKDAHAMLDTFGDSSACMHLIVSLPEEMPLRESLDLTALTRAIFPNNPPFYLVNRCFPEVSAELLRRFPEPDTRSIPESAGHYAVSRSRLEEHNLRIWRDAKITFQTLPHTIPLPDLLPRTILEGWSR